MNELDAIRARRAAITPGVWTVRPDTHLVVRDWQIVASVSLTDDDETRVTAEFIAAAPADVDTLLAMVERLTEREQFLLTQYQAGWNEAMRTVAAMAGPEQDYADVLRLRAEVEQLTAQLAAERDAARRHAAYVAAYVAACVDECGSYKP